MHFFGNVSWSKIHYLLFRGESVTGRRITLVDRVLDQGLLDSFVLGAREAETSQILIFCVVFAPAGDSGLVRVIYTLYGSFLVDDHCFYELSDAISVV